MYSRTYDAQRFSPLKQITRQNVGQLREVFKKELGTGNQESIPIVLPAACCIWSRPGASVLAVDATTGATIWEHKRPTGASADEGARHLRRHGLLRVARRLHRGARCAHGCGEMGNEVERKSDLRCRSSPTARCSPGAPVEPSATTVTSRRTTRKPVKRRGASIPCRPQANRATRRGEARLRQDGWPRPWGLAGGYDPVRRLIFWGVANPMPNTRAARHGGNARAIPLSRRRISTAIRPWRSIPTPASCLVLPASAWRRLGPGLHERARRWCAPRSVPIRSSSSGSIRTSPRASRATSR